MRLILLVLLLSINTAYAATSFNLENVKIKELAKIVFIDLLKTNYIASESFQRSENIVTINLKDKTDKQILEITKQLLKNNGYQLLDQGSHFYIDQLSTSTADKIPYLYKPKYRSVSYLTDMVSAVFETGRFTFQSKQSNQNSKTNPEISDTGTSAYSVLQRPQDAFIFLGTKDEVEILKTLITELDKPSNEILVKAYLYEVTNTNSKTSSFNLAMSLLNKQLGLSITAPVLANTISLKIPNLESVFSALSTDTRFKVLSNPQLRVKDGTNANFTVGAETPILGAVITSNGQSTQSVQYKSSGTILDVTPTIRSESIELFIKQQVSNFIKTTNGVNNSPTLIKRELSSTITANDGELVIIGGLNENTETKDKTGISFLPDFLKANSSDQNNTDILLILQATRL